MYQSLKYNEVISIIIFHLISFVIFLLELTCFIFHLIYFFIFNGFHYAIFSSFSPYMLCIFCVTKRFNFQSMLNILKKIYSPLLCSFFHTNIGLIQLQFSDVQTCSSTCVYVRRYVLRTVQLH